MMTIAEFAAHVAQGARGQWFNGTFDVEGVGAVGIKAHGLWVQRMTWDGLADGGEFKTQKALKAWIVSSLKGRA